MSVLEIASSVSTPLALGGLLAALFFLFLKSLIAKNILTTLTADGTQHIISKAVDYLFYLALVGCLLGVLSYILPSLLNSPKVTDERKRELGIEAIKKDISALRGNYYETIDLYGESACEEVRKQAKILGQLIYDAPVSGTRGSYLVLKYQYAARAFTMAADVEPSGQARVELVQMAIDSALKSMASIESLKQEGQNGDTQAWESYQWVISDNGHNRTLWILAKAYAIRSYETGQELKKVADTLSKIDSSYRSRWEPNTEPVIAWALHSDSTSKPTNPCSSEPPLSVALGSGFRDRV